MSHATPASGVSRLAVARAGLRLPRWSAFAWCSIAATTLFIAITWWWLTQDHSVPGTEPGAQLYASIIEERMLHAGDLLGPISYHAIHPPLVTIVGAVSMLLGGVGLSAPVIGENLFFVPLLALGCYQTAKLVAGPRAGPLAVGFALGSPLVIEQFHVFMADAPEAALVALSVWLLLASDRFRNLRFAAAAGAAVGLGVEIKQQFPLFVVGLLLVVLLREGGWRNRRGIGVFALATFVVGAPWYLVHISELAEFARDSVGAATPGTIPPRWSLTNLGWYFWALLNGLLFAPLFAFAAIGVVKATAAVVRRRADLGLAPELLGGMLVAWIAITITPIHVVRYMMPMIVYFAVLGTVWIVRLRTTPRAIATGALALAVVATTLGASFGAGERVRIMLTSRHIPDRAVYGIASPDQVVFYANRNFLVSGPQRAGDVLALLKALRRHGVLGISWLPAQTNPDVFEPHGLYTLATIADLGVQPEFNPSQMPQHIALLIRANQFGTAPPCLRLSDGTGVWVRFGRAVDLTNPSYCPFRRPAFYGP